MKFVPTMIATLAMSKAYTEALIASGEECNIALAEMNGEDIEIMIAPQPALSREHVLVSINVPCPMAISIQCMDNLRSMEEIAAHRDAVAS